MTDLSQTITGGHAPAPRISMPDFVDWHMILDRELDQLSRPEHGVLSSLGFVALGTVLGLIAPVMSAWEKIAASPPIPLNRAEFANLAAFFVCVGLMFVCLSIAGLGWWRNRGLADEIRKRPKRGAFATPESASPGV
jgi:hypothetical protein